MSMERQQMDLIYNLMRYIGRHAEDSAAFKLFFDAFLSDMVSREKDRPVLDGGWRIGFRRVLCRDNVVLAAALPYAIREDGKETPLFPWELDALRAAGIPLFSDLLTEVPGEDGEPILTMETFVCPEPSDWRFPAVAVPPEAKDFLFAKGLLLRDDLYRRSRYIPTEEGKRLGLCTVSWFRPPNFARMKGLSCSTAGWLYRLWEPREKPPLWRPRSLDTRLDRMRNRRSSNLGHAVASLERLDAMPLEPALLPCMNREFLEMHLEWLQTMCPPGTTYGQAARDVDRYLRSDAEEVQNEGYVFFSSLIALFLGDWHARITKSPVRRADSQKITALHQTKPAGRSLSERLARAGVSENGAPYLPLTGDALEDVLQGLSTLIGTDEPVRSFRQKVLPQILSDWEQSEDASTVQWDGTFDGLIGCLINNGAPYDNFAWDLGMDSLSRLNYGCEQVVYWLLVEPFCLLDRARALEVECVQLLERFQAWNESLRQELEGMNFDGTVC